MRIIPGEMSLNTDCWEGSFSEWEQKVSLLVPTLSPHVMGGE